MDYSSLGTVTGACHAPVAGGQGKAPRIPVPIEKPADFEMDGREDFQNSFCQVGGGIEANSVAERLTVTPCFEDGGTHKPKKAAEASAEAAYPLGECNVLLMAPLSKVLLRLLLAKVTKPAAAAAKGISIKLPQFRR